MSLGKIGVLEVDSPQLGTKTKWGTGRYWLFLPLVQLRVDGAEKMGDRSWG